MGKVRWGILSTGRIAHQFARDMAYVANSEIVAVSSRTLDHARAFGAQFDIPRVHEHVESLLADPEVDAIYVASPHTLHYSNAIEAMRAGNAVLCEKPLVTNVTDCERLIRAAEEHGVLLMEAMWTWFLPAIRKAQAWVAEGRIGRIVQIKADFGYPMRPYGPERREYNAQLGGGALLDMGIYPVALVCLFMGRAPGDVRVFAKRAPNGVEDDLSAILDYGDCIATIGTSFRARLPNWAHIIGEDGYIAIPDFFRASECLLYETDALIERFADARNTIGLSFETEAFADDVLNGRTESAVVPLAASLLIQQVMASIRERATGN